MCYSVNFVVFFYVLFSDATGTVETVDMWILWKRTGTRWLWGRQWFWYPTGGNMLTSIMPGCRTHSSRYRLPVLTPSVTDAGLHSVDQCCGAGPLLTGSGSRYFFFTGSGSSSYKNRLKSSKKTCFCLHIFTPAPAPTGSATLQWTPVTWMPASD